jgi:hypothetical protein
LTLNGARVKRRYPLLSEVLRAQTVHSQAVPGKSKEVPVEPKKYIIFKPIGVDHWQLNRLHEFAESPQSHVFSGPTNKGYACVKILSSKLDAEYGTYTLEIQVTTEMERYEYTDAEGKNHDQPVKRGVMPEDTKLGIHHIQVPSEILLKILRDLDLLNLKLTATEKY